MNINKTIIQGHNLDIYILDIDICVVVSDWPDFPEVRYQSVRKISFEVAHDKIYYSLHYSSTWDVHNVSNTDETNVNS